MKRAGYSRPLGHYVGKWWVSGQIGGRFRLCLHGVAQPLPEHQARVDRISGGV